MSDPASTDRDDSGNSSRFSQLVSRYAVAIVVFWFVLAIVVRGTAPSWQSLALDGDFDYLPQDRPSVAGERLLDAAFPVNRPRSQVVLVIARQTGDFDAADELTSLDLLRRLHHRLAETLIASAAQEPADAANPARAQLLQRARAALDQAIEVDEAYFEQLQTVAGHEALPVRSIRLTIAYWDRANLLQTLDLPLEAGPDMQAALTLDPEIATWAKPIAERDLSAWSSLLGLSSWNDPVLGQRMLKPSARLVVLQSQSELAATHNIAFLDAIQATIRETRAAHAMLLRPGLEILPTGSAAIGGATLTAAREAIRYTEWFTVLTVLAILALVYRSPLLVAVPLVSIGLAVAVSTGVIAWLTHLSSAWGAGAWGLRIFTTSRIFLFVILFGAGVDYCLFLIARVREESAQWAWEVAIRRSLTGVSSALLGSGLTTVLGLGMLWIANFGKYHHTGPMIAICLLIGLAICLTFTPALLRLLGPGVFWPSRVGPAHVTTRFIPSGNGPPTGYWGLLALGLTRSPVLLLLLGIGGLLPPAIYGWLKEGSVTYDISSQLAASSESRRGFRLLDEHFGIGEVNPTTVLLLREMPVSKEQLGDDTKRMVKEIYAIEGVQAVRYSDDPLGDFPPDRVMGLFSKDAWQRRALKSHRLSTDYFFSETPDHSGRLIRLDVVMAGNPFELETARRVEGLDSWLRAESQLVDSPIRGSKVLLAGTTPSIIDLRNVTSDDHRRIKLAVVLVVFAVLVLVIRRIALCGYLMFTVLLSYYATLGLTILFFSSLLGEDYLGLDWKLPLFLFVILVAVGQDYNVYLVTRIVEEQQLGPGALSALRRALARTGGIITACGLVMAGTFFSMTASAWFPPIRAWFTGSPTASEGTLRGIVELGFALGLGVLLDTFYVRTLLVPSFVAATDRWRSRSRESQP